MVIVGSHFRELSGPKNLKYTKVNSPTKFQGNIRDIAGIRVEKGRLGVIVCGYSLPGGSDTMCSTYVKGV